MTRWIKKLLFRLRVAWFRAFVRCADCGGPIGRDRGPQDGWQLEDGRTVCQRCCVVDFGKITQAVVAEHRARLAQD